MIRFSTRTIHTAGALALLVGIVLAAPLPGAVLASELETSPTRRLLERALNMPSPALDGVARFASVAPAAELAAQPVPPTNRVVLSPADVGPEFVVFPVEEPQEEAEVDYEFQVLVRPARFSTYIEPEGIVGVSSVAIFYPDPAQAEKDLGETAADLARSGRNQVSPSIGDRAFGAALWGRGPFDPANKVLVFRRGSVLGIVVVHTYDDPANFADTLPLAQVMAERVQ